MGVIDKEAFYLVLSPDKASVCRADPSDEVLGVAYRDNGSLCYILTLNRNQSAKAPTLELHYYDERNNYKHFAFKKSLPTNMLCHHFNPYKNRLYWVGSHTLKADASLVYVELELDSGQASLLEDIASAKAKLTHMAITHNALGGLTYFAGRNDQGHFVVSCLNETTREISYM